MSEGLGIALIALVLFLIVVILRQRSNNKLRKSDELVTIGRESQWIDIIKNALAPKWPLIPDGLWTEVLEASPSELMAMGGAIFGNIAFAERYADDDATEEDKKKRVLDESNDRETRLLMSMEHEPLHNWSHFAETLAGLGNLKKVLQVPREMVR